MIHDLLVVTHNYPRSPGDPAGAFVERLARAAIDRSWRVRVLAPGGAGLPDREVRNGIEIHRFPYPLSQAAPVAYRGDLHLRSRRSPATLLTLPGFLSAFRRAFRRLVRERRPDVVHAHWWFPGGWAARWNGPLVITCHGSDVRLLDRSWLARHLAGRVFERAAMVTTVSDFLAADLRRAFPALPVKTMYLPIEDARFAAGRSMERVKPPRLLYAGNLLASKGIDVLIRAVSRLQHEGIACGLRILGEGPDGARLHALATELAVGNISWSGFVDQTTMPAEYGAATITVLPTLGAAEGLGLTLVEAQLAGSAVIGSATGGIPEVVRDGETGLLVPPADVDALAAAGRRLLTDDALLERLRAGGYRHALARFGMQAATEPFMSLLNDVAAD